MLNKCCSMVNDLEGFPYTYERQLRRVPGNDLFMNCELCVKKIRKIAREFRVSRKQSDVE